MRGPRTPWAGRRAGLVLLSIAAAALAGLVPVEGRLGRAVRGPASETATTPLAAPHEVAAALFLGSFRAIALDAIWVEIIARSDRREYERILPLAELATALDPEAEEMWWVLAFTLAVDIPAFRVDRDPVSAWPWIRAGIRKIQEGARKNPRSWRLAAYDGYLVDAYVAPREPLAARFRGDRAGTNPEGLEPIEYARRRYEAATRLPGHGLFADSRLLTVLARLERREAGLAFLDHVRREHPDAPADWVEGWEDTFAPP